jgi:hypothetical protein
MMLATRDEHARAAEQVDVDVGDRSDKCVASALASSATDLDAVAHVARALPPLVTRPRAAQRQLHQQRHEEHELPAAALSRKKSTTSQCCGWHHIGRWLRSSCCCYHHSWDRGRGPPQKGAQDEELPLIQVSVAEVLPASETIEFAKIRARAQRYVDTGNVHKCQQLLRRVAAKYTPQRLGRNLSIVGDAEDGGESSTNSLVPRARSLLQGATLIMLEQKLDACKRALTHENATRACHDQFMSSPLSWTSAD